MRNPSPIAHSVLRQIQVKLAYMVEEEIFKQDKLLHEGVAVDSVITLKWDSKLVDLGNRGQVDLKIAHYVVNCAEHLGKPLDLSVATDKGNVSTLPLQASIFRTPENVAVFACPQVPPVS